MQPKVALVLEITTHGSRLLRYNIGTHSTILINIARVTFVPHKKGPLCVFVTSPNEVSSGTYTRIIKFGPCAYRV